MKSLQVIAFVSLLLILGGAASPAWSQNEDAEGYVRYGDRLARYKKDWRKAIYAYQRALELDPGNPRAHLGLGRVFLQREEYLRAAGEFEAAVTDARSREIELFATKADAINFYLAVAQLMTEKLKQPSRAQPFLELAKELNPDNSRLKNLEEAAQRLKDSGAGEAPVVDGFALSIDVPDKQEEARPVISVLEEARQRLQREFGFDHREPVPLTVLTRLAFEAQASLFLAGASLGVGTGDRVTIQTSGADPTSDIFRELLFHQFSRFWLGAYLEADPPRWLADGFAAWSQKFAVDRSIHVPRTAMEGYRMVDYLAEQSRSRFRQFLADLKTTRDVTLTLQNQYEISLEELAKQGKP